MNVTPVEEKILFTDVVLSVLKIVIATMNILYTKSHTKILPNRLLVIVVNPSINCHVVLEHLLHGKDNVKQPFYECKDCFNNPSEEVCCFPCANKCHAKHNLTPCSQPPFESYCHCGLHCCKSLCH